MEARSAVLESRAICVAIVSWILVLATRSSSVSGFADVAASPTSTEVNTQKSLSVAPVITIHKSGDMQIEFELRNDSQKAFRYLMGSRLPRSVAQLHILLLKDGTPVPRIVHESEPPAMTKENVRSLKPGQSIVYSISLAEYGFDQRRGNLPAGRYALRVQYSEHKESVTARTLGLTPTEINDTVLLIDLVEEKSARWLPYAYVMGVMVAFGLLELARRRYGSCRNTSSSTVEGGQSLNANDREE